MDDFLDDQFSDEQPESAEFDREFSIDFSAYGDVFLPIASAADLRHERLEFELERISILSGEDLLRDLRTASGEYDSIPIALINKDYERGLINIARMSREDLIREMQLAKYSALPQDENADEDTESPLEQNRPRNIP